MAAAIVSDDRVSSSTSTDEDDQGSYSEGSIDEEKTSKWRLMLGGTATLPVLLTLSCTRTILECCSKTKIAVLNILCSDWMFLALLGIVMALCSFGMDYCIEKIQDSKAFFTTSGTHGSQSTCFSPLVAIWGYNQYGRPIRCLGRFHDRSRTLLVRLLPFDCAASNR